MYVVVYRDVRDVQFLPEKLTNKSAKESFEQHNKIESDYYHLFSGKSVHFILYCNYYLKKGLHML